MWSDPYILNVLADSRYSRNWRFKAKGKADVFSLCRYHPITIPSDLRPFLHFSPNGWRSLADGCSSPFRILHAVYGSDRLKPTRWAVSTERLCWHKIRLTSGSSCPPQPYGYADTRSVSDHVLTALIFLHLFKMPRVSAPLQNRSHLAYMSLSFLWALTTTTNLKQEWLLSF